MGNGCNSTLHFGRPLNNEEGVLLVGLCSSHGLRHAFEFNDSSYECVHVQLTPKQDRKSSFYNHNTNIPQSLTWIPNDIYAASTKLGATSLCNRLRIISVNPVS